jgi:hypothetical protein
MQGLHQKKTGFFNSKGLVISQLSPSPRNASGHAPQVRGEGTKISITKTNWLKFLCPNRRSSRRRGEIGKSASPSPPRRGIQGEVFCSNHAAGGLGLFQGPEAFRGMPGDMGKNPGEMIGVIKAYLVGDLLYS